MGVKYNHIILRESAGIIRMSDLTGLDKNPLKSRFAGDKSSDVTLNQGVQGSSP